MIPKSVVTQDLGPLDSVPKVFIGAQMSHFIVKLLFLDSLSWLSGGKIAIPLKRSDEFFNFQTKWQDLVAFLGTSSWT